MPLKSMEILLWHSAALDVTFIGLQNARPANPSIQAAKEWLRDNNVNLLQWLSQSPDQEFVVGLDSEYACKHIFCVLSYLFHVAG